MATTALGFYRKSQTIDQLRSERPKSLTSLHTAINLAISDIHTRLEILEREYYGNKIAEEEILSLTPAFRDVMKNLQIVQLHSAWQVDDVLKRPDILTEGMYQGDLKHFETIKMFDTRLKTFVPNKFQDIKNQLCDILIFLGKYCVSFFHGKEDSYLETAYSYENKRKELTELIKKNIDRISDIIVTYRKGGLTLKLLGMYANDLARRCDCYEIPILFIFSDVCSSVRDACANIMRWVELDSGYALFLHNDLVEMQRKKDDHFRKVRDLREKHCQLEHKIKNMLRDLDEIAKSLQRFKNRERDIRDNVVKLKLTIEDLETELEARERDLKTLRKAARKVAAAETTGNSRTGSRAESPSLVAPQGTTERFGSGRSITAHDDTVEAVGREISRIRITMNALSRQIISQNSKLKLVDEKRESLTKKKSILIKLQKLSMTQETELVLEEHELARLERCYNQLKDIHTFRISTDITKKIFYNIPITPTKGGVSKPITNSHGDSKPESKGTSDSLHKWSKRVANAIGTEWPKLYRALPFVPERIDSQRDEDVTKMYTTQKRMSSEMQALESLIRWRRFHPRANVEELKESLIAIGRKDVLDRSVEMMKRRDPPRQLGKGWQRVRQIRQGVQAVHLLRSPSPPRIRRSPIKHVSLARGLSEESLLAIK